MEIGASSGLQGLWDLTSTRKIQAEPARSYKAVQSYTTHSGDSVEISDEARELYSMMIHKYDKQSSQTGEAGQADEGQGGGAGGMDSSGEASSIDEIKKQIQALKSQLAGLASQMGNGADQGVMSKMNALEAQIAALESQLNQMAA